MPLYDLRCTTCGNVLIDVWERVEPTVRAHCECGGVWERAMLTKASAVSGDEIHVEIKHGLCNPDGSAKLYTSKAELKRAEKAKGLTNYVVHRGSKGGDRSKHTSRWV